ncbi:MAG: PEP-CTERM sorting domain-containing protein [Methylococcaceae bacterium]|nr:PEP-CTERM sorting domain-containing protein [Methylococcaceae bacterium]
MKKHIYSAFALFALLTGAAQANVLDFGYQEHVAADAVDAFAFNVDAGNTDIVNIYTNTSAPANPYLTLWSTTAANPTLASDWVLVGSNDDTALVNYFEVGQPFDSQLKLNLAEGTYLATITGSGYTPAGTSLADGFIGSSTESYFAYNFTVDGNVSAVPVPAAVWLFGTGLMGFLGLSKRKSQRLVA